jgi:uncharacterized surface protein with fasciclin (FAS1) repeats
VDDAVRGRDVGSDDACAADGHGATVIKANVMATNGVIHVINKVLIP